MLQVKKKNNNFWDDQMYLSQRHSQNEKLTKTQVSKRLNVTSGGPKCVGMKRTDRGLSASLQGAVRTSKVSTRP